MKKLQVIDKREILGMEITTYGDLENPKFLAKDVAEWIGYDPSSVNKMINNVDEDEKLNGIIFRAGQNREMTFLTEDGLYEVLMQSRKPIAKQFKKKVKKLLKELRLNQYQIKQNTISELNETVADLQGTITEYKKLWKITCSRKQQYIKYIKNRLGIEKANKEFEQVKARLFLILGVEKWEDIDFETSNNLIQIIDESIKVIKSERPYKQLSYFEY